MIAAPARPGSDLARADLAEKRAQAIADYFMAKGMSFPIHVRGYGEHCLAQERRHGSRRQDTGLAGFRSIARGSARGEGQRASADALA